MLKEIILGYAPEVRLMEIEDGEESVVETAQPNPSPSPSLRSLGREYVVIILDSNVDFFFFWGPPLFSRRFIGVRIKANAR
jgi:hypothetical protein